jgi:hypothetical protein
MICQDVLETGGLTPPSGSLQAGRSGAAAFHN